MKAFWWFKENSIAGMARPGFNGIHWFDLPFEEALIFGWLGQRTSDRKTLQSLHEHIRDYGGKVANFYQVEPETFLNLQEKIKDNKWAEEIFRNVGQKTKTVRNFEMDSDSITFQLCEERLQFEIDFLKQQKISTVIALTEEHHQKEILEKHFERRFECTTI
jgi:hypothetical protein